QRFDVLLLALKPLETKRGVLLANQLRPRRIERQPRWSVTGVGDLDRRRLILDDPPVGGADDGGVLPLDLPLVESGQGLRRLRLDLPFEQQPGRSLFFAAVRRGPESVPSQLERLRSQNALVLLVDRLQLRRLLEPGVCEITLARDRFHE